MRAAYAVVGMDPADVTRFWSHVDRGATGCWTWTASTRPASCGEYGRFWLNGRTESAHRVAYQLQVGPIPDGHVVHHVCENRLCMRGTHLRAVTHAENLHASDTPAARNAAVTHCPAGHPYDEANTYRPPGRRERHCRACRREDARARRSRA